MVVIPAANKMKAKQVTTGRDWQREWHRIMDAELDSGPATNAPSELPELDCDFDLHFEVWHLSDAALGRCFGVLPYGAVMADRAIQMRSMLRSNPPEPLSESEALSVLKRGIAALASHVGTDFGSADAIRVVYGDSKKLIETFMAADTPTIDLDDQLAALARKHSGQLGEDAFFFTSEILYRLASDYSAAHWIAWPLCHDVTESDPYWNFALLSGHKYYPGLDGKGIFMFVEE